MKKFYLFLITCLLAFNANSQCSFFFNPQMACDTLCDKVITIWSNNSPGPFDLFVDGVFHSTITNQATVGPFCPGTYDLTLTNSSGCSYSDSVTIILTPLHNINFISQQPTCPTCNDGSITAYVTTSPVFSSLIWNWSTGATTFFADSSTISNLTAGVYCVTVDDSAGCVVTACDTLLSATGSVIAGNVYLDLDTNGTQNGLEPGLNNFQVEVNPGGYTSWSSSSGNYFIAVPNGSYTVSLNMQPNWSLTSAPATYNTTVNGSFLAGHDFGILPDTASPNADILITAGWPRANWTSHYFISYSNTALILADGEIIFNLDPQVTYNSATPAPTTISGNTYTWSFNDLYPFNPQNIHLNVTMPPTLGTALSSTAILNLTDNSSNIIFSDTATTNQVVVSSWDPNDKLALPEGFGAQNIVPLNSISDYTIRFQNTGTDTAFVVVIIDTLSSLLDRSTFEILAASHEMNTDMDQNGILTFTFNNILLPDSNINEPGSHGFIRYSIKPVTPVADPTVITNTAYIYFDQNPAVITNTTLTTFSDNLLSITEMNGAGIIKAYPNPFSNEVTIRFEKNVNVKVDLYDYSGRIIKNYLINNSASFVIKRQEMKPGIYLLKLTTEEGVSTLKLIVK